MLLIVAATNLRAQCDKTGNLFGIPEELVRNRFTEVDMLYGHPYTLFNKRDYGHVNFSIEAEINYIRDRINDNDQVKLAYMAILNVANGPKPDEVTSVDPGVNFSPLAKWAKYNAFVLLIGLGADGNTIDVSKYEQNYNDAIFYMNYDGTDGSNKQMGKVIVFANTAMCWIQAYDLYKTYKILNSHTDPARRDPSDFDRNDGSCRDRNKMRQMAKKLFDNSMGLQYNWGTANHPAGWKKNHGIIAASALLTCAIVLNDAGVRDIRGRWKPSRWARDANAAIRDCFFRGYHEFTYNVPTTSADGRAGYNEGPDYWKYTLQTFAPTMLAANNMCPGWHEDNWYRDARIQEICKWYESIRLQDGQLPTYDDSSIGGADNTQALIRSEYDRG